MIITPELTPRPSNNVDGGSLVFVPIDGEWGIAHGNGNIFMLKQLRNRHQPSGPVADFGSDYLIEPDVEGSARILFPFESELLPRGALCIFPTENGLEYCIWLAPTDPGREVELQSLGTGRTLHRNTPLDEGVGFSRWKIGLERASGQSPAWVFKSYDEEEPATAST